MADFSELMRNPQVQGMVQKMAQQRQPGQGAPQGMQRAMKQPANPLSALADAYPKMKEASDKMKVEDAERKAKKLKFDMMFKKAEQAYKLKEQQAQMQQGQQQIQDARNSV